MDGRFDTDEFEDLIREQADKFYLVPSERVWNGIYNNLRPGSKWPSLGMGLVILISLVWIGSSHQPQVKENALQAEAQNNKQLTVEGPIDPQTVNLNSKAKDYSKSQSATMVLSKQAPANNLRKNSQAGLTERVAVPSLPLDDNSVMRSNQTIERAETVPDEHKPVKASEVSVPVSESADKDNIPSLPVTDKGVSQADGSRGFADLTVSALSDGVMPELPETKKITLSRLISEATVAAVGVASAAATKKPAAKVRKAQWEFFVAPVVANAHLNKIDIQAPQSQSLLANSNIVGFDISKRSLAGIQGGADAIYKINDVLSARTGAHIAYSGYKIKADFVHPTFASVTFVNREGALSNKSYMTYYGNKGNAGKMNLNNYRLTLSVPLGVDWKVYENDNVRVIVMSAVEPLALLDANSFVVSSDTRNFVEDPDLLRRFNVNGNIGTLIDFKGSRVNWSMGPVFSYQILSSYQNIYPIREHLVNYGFRIGVKKSR